MFPVFDLNNIKIKCYLEPVHQEPRGSVLGPLIFTMHRGAKKSTSKDINKKAEPESKGPSTEPRDSWCTGSK